MKNFIKNIILLAGVIVISYFAAPYFGSWYDKFSPLSSTSIFSFTRDELAFVVGIPFAYIFFEILLFQLFAAGNKKSWTIWLLVPSLLFFMSGDIEHIYLPIILGLIAFGLATIIRKVFARKPSSPIPNNL